jgi:hypothetical protein
VRHHAIPGALLLALASAVGGGRGAPTSVPAPKPTPLLVIPDPVVPPPPTQASGSYNHGRDFAADIRLVPSPRRRDAAGPFAALSGALGPPRMTAPVLHMAERAPRGLDLAELSIYSFIP